MNRAYLSFFMLILTTCLSFATDPISWEVKRNIRQIFEEQNRVAHGEISITTEDQVEKPAQELGHYFKLLDLVHDFGGLSYLETAAEKAKSNRDWIVERIFNRQDLEGYRDLIFRDQTLINALCTKKLRIMLPGGRYLDTASFDGLDDQIDYWAFEEAKLRHLTQARSDIETFKQKGYHF